MPARDMDRRAETAAHPRRFPRATLLDAALLCAAVPGTTGCSRASETSSTSLVDLINRARWRAAPSSSGWP